MLDEPTEHYLRAVHDSAGACNYTLLGGTIDPATFQQLDHLYDRAVSELHRTHLLLTAAAQRHQTTQHNRSASPDPTPGRL